MRMVGGRAAWRAWRVLEPRIARRRKAASPVLACSQHFTYYPLCCSHEGWNGRGEENLIVLMPLAPLVPDVCATQADETLL